MYKYIDKQADVFKGSIQYCDGIFSFHYKINGEK